jgi:hypothetical protein
MHHLGIDLGWYANHNGDFSGDIEIGNSASGEKITVPFFVLAAIVAEKVRQDRISALEDAKPDDLLR